VTLSLSSAYGKTQDSVYALTSWNNLFQFCKSKILFRFFTDFSFKGWRDDWSV